MILSLPIKKKKIKTEPESIKVPRSLQSVAADFKHLPTPYIVTDPGKARSNATSFRELLPQVHLFYAIKANADEHIIRQLEDVVDGFDIASLGELEILQKAGISGERVLYSNPVKVPSHIDEAYRRGVRYFAFDSVTEINKLAEYAPGSNVYLRLKVSDYGSKFPLSKKFGVDQSHAVDYCSLAQDAGLQVKGVTFHVGSQSENLQAWKNAIEIAGKTIGKLRKKGMNVEFVNLGGGFPADYGEPTLSMNEVATTITESVARFLPPDIALLAEPGRYIAASTSVMVASVIGREHRSGMDWLYLDVGTFQGLIEPLEMKDWHYPLETDKNPKGYKKDFVLSGPTCDAYDTIGQDYHLPSDIEVRDRIYLGAVGAYSLVYASNFNGFSPPQVHYVDEEN